MATLQKLTVAATILIRRIKLMMGTATGIALTYGVYKTILGGQPYLRRAQNEGPESVSNNVQHPPHEIRIAEDEDPGTLSHSARESHIETSVDQYEDLQTVSQSVHNSVNETSTAEGKAERPNQGTKQPRKEGLRHGSHDGHKPPEENAEELKTLADLETVDDPTRHGLQPRPPPAVYLDLAASARSQPSVTSHDRAHSLFLWIGIKSEADPCQVACRAARVQELVKQVQEPNESSCGDHHVLAGVGFGPEFYKVVRGNVPQPFSNAKHNLISSKSVGGDILIHAKSNDLDALKQLTKEVLDHLPQDSVLWHEETYGEHSDPEVIDKHVQGDEPVNVLNYKYTKEEMELFPPKVPMDQEKPNVLFVTDTGIEDTVIKRTQAAVDPKTGGSYVMTQKWVHDVQLVDSNGEAAMNEWVDKAWEECAGPPGERKFRSQTILAAELAHESMDKWMNTAYKECLAIQEKHPDSQIMCTPGNPGVCPFRVLRQSLPYKCQSGQSGLFFVCYSSTPAYNELLLDQLVASACGGGKLNKACRNVFRLSHNVRSACWYFPGIQELREMT